MSPSAVSPRRRSVAMRGSSSAISPRTASIVTRAAPPRHESCAGLEEDEGRELAVAGASALEDLADSPHIDLLVDHRGLEPAPLERLRRVAITAQRHVHGASQIDQPVLVL